MPGMDVSLYLVWLTAFALILFRWTTVQGVTCAIDPAGYSGGGSYETYSFEAEEGVLLVPRRLIGTVTLSGNDSSRYSFDEPYFAKPNNSKSKPRPARFEIVFLNVSSSDYATTISMPKQDSVAITETPTKPNVIAPNADISCVIAKIYQIDDLDREYSDIHFLTIIDADEVSYWGLPIVVVIKVTDINDNSPTFVEDTLSTRISNDIMPGSIVAEIKAIDKDTGFNADLRYSLPCTTKRRGHEPESPDLPNFVIHEQHGVVAVVGPVVNLVPPTKITFPVIVKDGGGRKSNVVNRARANVTIYVVDYAWAPDELNQTNQSITSIDLDVCETDPTGISGDGLFETHTFETEEGILLVPRKLIGTVTLSGDDSSRYSFDEPYFSKPYNLKSKPRPAHFEIVFVNVSSSDYAMTTSMPVHGPVAITDSPNSDKARSSSKVYFRNATPIPTHHSNDTALNYEGGTTSWSTVTSSYMNTTSPTTVNLTSATVTPTASTPDTNIRCVIAKIYQIYDLDREDSDTHYLTISNANDSLWGFPVVVVIKVTDINDNSPTFVKDTLNTRISKNVSPGSIVAEIKAVDKDIGINADLRYSIPFNTERRGNEPGSPEFPTIVIHENHGIVALVSPIADLVPPTKITFSVVVKDKGDSYVANRATASVTISIVDDNWVPEPPADVSITISAGAIVGIVLGSIVLGILTTVGFIYWRRRSRHCQRNGHLELMLDDENLISA